MSIFERLRVHLVIVGTYIQSNVYTCMQIPTLNLFHTSGREKFHVVQVGVEWRRCGLGYSLVDSSARRTTSNAKDESSLEEVQAGEDKQGGAEGEDKQGGAEGEDRRCNVDAEKGEQVGRFAIEGYRVGGWWFGVVRVALKISPCR